MGRAAKTGGSHVQDAMRECAADRGALLAGASSLFYVCGLKSMEEGVVLALRDIAESAAGVNWDEVGAELKGKGGCTFKTY